VWIDGDSDGMAWARKAIALVQSSGHKTTFEAEFSALEKTTLTKGDA
jgi:hypothetical protein